MLAYIRHRRLRVSLIILLGLLANGCVIKLDKIRAITFNQKVNQATEKMMTVEAGGEIRLTSANGAYDYYLFISPGALNKNTSIKMEVTSESDAVINLLPIGFYLINLSC